MKKLLFLITGMSVIVACNSNQKATSSDSAKVDTTKKTTVTDVPKPDETQNWTFQTDTDKMTSKERYFATVAAINKLEFDSPYDGGSIATIMLRNQNKKNEILLQIDKGQFVCSSSDGCSINVRFDDSPAIKFNGTEPSDGSSALLFIAPEKKFIANLKKAKKIIVQAEFYESGLKTMEFNVSGLKWDR